MPFFLFKLKIKLFYLYLNNNEYYRIKKETNKKLAPLNL